MYREDIRSLFVWKQPVFHAVVDDSVLACEIPDFVCSLRVVMFV